MHRSEASELDTCADCGAEVHVARDRTFAAPGDRVLCFACAERRGGSYDELHDVWTQAPDLSGLPTPDLG